MCDSPSPLYAFTKERLECRIEKLQQFTERDLSGNQGIPRDRLISGRVYNHQGEGHVWINRENKFKHFERAEKCEPSERPV